MVSNRPASAAVLAGLGGFCFGCWAASSPAWGFALLAAAIPWGWRRGGPWRATLAALIFASAGWGWATLAMADAARTGAEISAAFPAGKRAVNLVLEGEIRRTDTGSAWNASFETPLGGKKTTVGVRTYFPGNFHGSEGQSVSGVALVGIPENEGNLDSSRYFRSRNIYLSAYFPIYELSGNPSIVAKTRNFILDILDRTYPPEIRGIVAGVLLGDKTRIPPETSKDFRNSGMSHILVASGSNVAFVLAALAFFARKLPSAFFIPLLAAGAFGYAFIAGGDIPSMRAAIMGSIAAGAAFAGIKSRPGPLLLGTLAAFCLANPLSISYDPSLRLSFAATAGILFLSGPIAEKLAFLGKFPAAREAFGLALAAALATWPVSAADFGGANAWGLAANLAAGWTAAPVMAFAAASALLSNVPLLGAPLGFGAYVPAKFLAWTASAVAALPGGRAEAPAWAAALALAAVSAWLLLPKKENRPEGRSETPEKTAA